MQPLELLGQSTTPDGSDLKLTRRTNEYIILANGKTLMSSRMHGSEEALATFACHGLRTAKHVCVLIGGLGMGFTLRAALDLLPRDAKIVVAELVPAVVEWNRGPLGPLAVAGAIKSRRHELDAILLDVDNGPSAFTTTENSRLYDDRGLADIHAALKAGGVLAVWSARDDRKFEQRLRYGGFVVEVERVRGRLKKGGPYHTIILAHTV